MKYINLPQNKIAIVDDEDYMRIQSHKWSIKKQKRRGNTDYARRSACQQSKYYTMQMHREVLNLKDPKIVVDHINGNGLDNRKENLRIVTRSQNQMNRPINKGTKTGYKGVHWYKPYNKWLARVVLNGRAEFLGYYTTKEEAAVAYNKGAIKYFGQYANLNKV